MNILPAVGSGVVQECFYCTNMLFAGNLFSKSLPPPPLRDKMVHP